MFIPHQLLNLNTIPRHLTVSSPWTGPGQLHRIVVGEKTSILRSSVALRHSTIGKSGLDIQILFNIYSLVDLLDAEVTEVRAEILDQLLCDTDSELHRCELRIDLDKKRLALQLN